MDCELFSSYSRRFGLFSSCFGVVCGLFSNYSFSSGIAVIIRLKEKEMERNVNIIDLIIIDLLINKIILLCILRFL